jgi:hypothetical protein
LFSDYAECSGYLFADARTCFNMPYLPKTYDIEPKLKDLTYLGGNRISLTYEWAVNGTPDQDYLCFVHFTTPGVGKPDDIAFQADHQLPKPTSQWQKGETIVDGPYEIEIPDQAFDTYDIVIGLYHGTRLPLKGIQAGGDRILVGRLQVTRDAAGKVTGVELGDTREAARNAPQQADFSAHLNPPSTMIRFPKLTTDGSVKVEKRPGSLVVFPYPRDREFQVTLDLQAIVPGVDAAARPQVKALAALTQADMGPVRATFTGGELSFRVGKPGAGRYVVSW